MPTFFVAASWYDGDETNVFLIKTDAATKKDAANDLIAIINKNIEEKQENDTDGRIFEPIAYLEGEDVESIIDNNDNMVDFCIKSLEELYP